MAQLDFSKFEAIVREAIDPQIRQQFEQSQSLYSQFVKGQPVDVNQRGYRIPYFTEAHPWTKPEGLEFYTQLMRGEVELPHDPGNEVACTICRDAFRMQIDAVRGKFPGIGNKGPMALSSRRNDVRRMLRELAAQQEQAA